MHCGSIRSDPSANQIGFFSSHKKPHFQSKHTKSVNYFELNWKYVTDFFYWFHFIVANSFTCLYFPLLLYSPHRSVCWAFLSTLATGTFITWFLSSSSSFPRWTHAPRTWALNYVCRLHIKIMYTFSWVNINMHALVKTILIFFDVFACILEHFYQCHSNHTSTCVSVTPVHTATHPHSFLIHPPQQSFWKNIVLGCWNMPYYCVQKGLPDKKLCVFLFAWLNVYRAR